MEVDRVKSIRESEEKGERASKRGMYDWCCTCVFLYFRERPAHAETQVRKPSLVTHSIVLHVLMLLTYTL